jgi:hypothetical protein
MFMSDSTKAPENNKTATEASNSTNADGNNNATIQKKSEEEENLRTLYKELSTSYRAIDDFRAKLLGFLPLATGTGIFLLLDKLKDITNLERPEKNALAAMGLFGFCITFGLFLYEIYGIKKCGSLIQAGKKMENLLGSGQFDNRPREVLHFINEPFAAGIIYPSVLSAWVLFCLKFFLSKR